MSVNNTKSKNVFDGLSTDNKPTGISSGSEFIGNDDKSVNKYFNGYGFSKIEQNGQRFVHIKNQDNAPETWADGNSSGTIAASGTFTLGDLTKYGFPYASLVFTEAGGANSVTVVWGVCQGALMFQIAGTSPNVNLTGTNTNGDVFTDIPVQVVGVEGATTGQAIGAGQYYLYKK